LDAAEQDKERYLKEVEAYKLTDAYKVYSKKQREHKHAKSNQAKQSRIESVPKPKEAKEPTKNSDVVGLEIPIFTEDFLDHNKGEFSSREIKRYFKNKIIQLANWNCDN